MFKDYSKWERSTRPKPLLWATFHHKAVISSNKGGIIPSPTGKSGINMAKDKCNASTVVRHVCLYALFCNLCFMNRKITKRCPKWFHNTPQTVYKHNTWKSGAGTDHLKEERQHQSTDGVYCKAGKPTLIVHLCLVYATLTTAICCSYSSHPEKTQ